MSMCMQLSLLSQITKQIRRISRKNFCSHLIFNLKISLHLHDLSTSRLEQLGKVNLNLFHFPSQLFIFRPLSAYAYFYKDNQAAIREQNPSAAFGDISKIVSSLWEALPPDNKTVSTQNVNKNNFQWKKH